MSDADFIDDEWTRPEHPPVDATDLGSGVWLSWNSKFNVDDQPMLWHWCNRSIYIAARDKGAESEARRLDWWYTPVWVPTGVGAHTLVQREPLTLNPSVFWRDCCGLHGWIQNGKWVLVPDAKV